MARTTLYAILCLLITSLSNASTDLTKQPDPEYTPGYLCTKDDPDFQKLDYSEKIPRCKRNFSQSKKKKVAEFYKVPPNKWDKYEFDHLLPLCAGGSNDIRNVFPQPQKEADEKDIIEARVCRGMRAGTMTQEQAVRMIKDFFADKGVMVFPEVY